MTCKKCNSESVGIRLDSRGLAEFYCKDCGVCIKKASSKELYDLIPKDVPQETKAEEPILQNTVPCRYCSEEYFFRYGRLGHQYIFVEHEYCPMCGRKRALIDRS